MNRKTTSPHDSNIFMNKTSDHYLNVDSFLLNEAIKASFILTGMISGDVGEEIRKNSEIYSVIELPRKIRDTSLQPTIFRCRVR
jgi:hypothetical protein